MHKGGECSAKVMGPRLKEQFAVVTGGSMGGAPRWHHPQFFIPTLVEAIVVHVYKNVANGNIHNLKSRCHLATKGLT